MDLDGVLDESRRTEEGDDGEAHVLARTGGHGRRPRGAQAVADRGAADPARPGAVPAAGWPTRCVDFVDEVRQGAAVRESELTEGTGIDGKLGAKPEDFR